MESKLKERLGNLKGLKLAQYNRASDTLCFQFGNLKEVISSHGVVRNVGNYALHIACSWRLTGPEGIIVASRDMYRPRIGWIGDINEFNWDIPGENLCDQKLGKFFHNAEDVNVISVNTDRYGGFSLGLSRDYSLEVFPDTSDESENWRLFIPNDKSSHIVLLGNGIEE